ncbi:MAG: gliding motility-associated C-terminal domain-containing protein, partial [Saprospiraceae bacterium]
QLPAIDAGPDQQICLGTSATLNATGSGTFEWSTGEQTQSISVAPIVTTTYYATLSSSGCNSTDSVQVIIKPLPVVDAGVNQFIFTGNSATLVATGGGTYLWSATETNDTIVVMPIITTIYTVTVTANGCEGTDEVTVFVNELPDIDLGPDITICLGDSAVLTAAGTVPIGTTFLWSSGEDVASITVFPIADISYSVTVTANSESSIDTINITVTTVPQGQPTISGNLEACAGDQFTYSVIPVTGATSYAWTVPLGASILPPIDQSSVTIVFGDAQSGNITVLPSNTCGDGVLATIAVILDTIPIAPASISGPANICASYTATYQVSSVFNANDYQWTVPTGAIILSGQGTSSILVDWNNSGGGQICMSVSNDCGMAPDLCLDVTTVLAPTANAGMDPLINCANPMAILDASGSSPAGLDFLWSTGSTTDTIQTILSGVFYVTVTNSTGCFDVDSVTVFADFNKPSIVIDASANTLTCDVLSIELTTKTNANNPTYVWLNGNTPIGTADSLILNASGCYQLELTDQNNGCFDTLSYCISENKTIPNLSISGPDQITCKEEIITLLGICNAITPSWNWTTVNGNFIGNVDKEDVKINHPGKYDLKVKDLLNGCEAVASKTISIDTTQPIVIITAAGFLDCTHLEALINSTGSSSGAEYEYIWTSKGGQILGDTFGIEIRATAEGIYILTIINAVNGCTAFDTAQMLRFAGHPEDVDLALEQPPCVTDCNGQLKIDDKGESLVYSFDGSSFGTIDQFDDLCPGNYALVVQDIFGCEWDTSIVVVQPNPITVDIGLDTTIISGTSVLIVPNFAGTIATVEWTPVGEGSLQGNNYLVTPATTTIYSLTLTDDHGCIAIDTKTINVKINENVFIPTGFTPNGDGENDVFTIFGKPGESHVKSLRIFNRWGDLVFESLDFDPNDTTQGWDGTFRGKMINSGIFVYSAEIEYSSGNSELR